MHVILKVLRVNEYQCFDGLVYDVFSSFYFLLVRSLFLFLFLLSAQLFPTAGRMFYTSISGLSSTCMITCTVL